MEPNYQVRKSNRGVLYRGNSFPLDSVLAHRARLGKLNSYSSIISQHQKLRQKKRRTVHAELILLLTVILALFALIAFSFRRSDR